MITRQGREPAVVAAYFDQVFGVDWRDAAGMSREDARIAQAFTPGTGWVRYPMRKRITVSWARKMRREGVTAVALTSEGRVADFRIEEVVR